MIGTRSLKVAQGIDLEATGVDIPENRAEFEKTGDINQALMPVQESIGSEIAAEQQALVQSPEARAAQERIDVTNEALAHFGKLPEGFIESLERYLQTKYFQ